MLVIGAPNSSNSLRLAEVAERMSVPSRLIERATDIDWDWLGQPLTLGVTAGASAPEVLVREVVDALRERFDVTDESKPTHIARAHESSSCRGSWSPDRAAGRTAARRDVHRRRVPRQSRPRRLGGTPAHGRQERERERVAVRRRTADDQQPHGADGRDPRPRGAQAAVPGRASHRQHLRPRRDHPLDLRLAAQRLADRRPQAGQERRSVAGTARRGRARHRIDWHWVKGHSGHPENDRVDALACAEADTQR